MIKIYTRDAWLSYFSKYPCIVIKDDGLIYNEDCLYKMISHPIGKIDFSRGEIYGEDYLKMFPLPVGYLKRNGDVIEIYGEEYRQKMFPLPIGYIQGDEYYSYDDYHRLFRIPAMYIERE